MVNSNSTDRPEGAEPARGLESEVTRLRAVAEAARLVHSSLDLDQLLDNILTAATSTLGAERGTVYVCDHERRELWSRVTAGSERIEIRLPFGKGLAGFSAETGQPVCANDVRAHPRFDANVDRRTGFRTENAVCSPVRDFNWEQLVTLMLLSFMPRKAERLATLEPARLSTLMSAPSRTSSATILLPARFRYSMGMCRH